LGSSLILTGGSGTIARGIADAWSEALPSWDILRPSRQELNVVNTQAVDEYFHRNPCDFLICCAGVSENQVLAKTSIDAWENSFTTNLDGASHCARAAAQHMKKRGSGHIVFLSSHSALHPPTGQIAYASAKAALIGLGKSLAQEWGDKNIRVNTVLPGWIDSPMTQATTPQRRETVLSQHALGRCNSLQALAAFLITLQTQMIHTSGQCFVLDSRII
jgi:3-oxoacyl-[acyl-carrier protein] reductase